jgi:hypothetical protein
MKSMRPTSLGYEAEEEMDPSTKWCRLSSPVLISINTRGQNVARSILCDD